MQVSTIQRTAAISAILFGGIALAGQFYGGDPNNYSGVVNWSGGGQPAMVFEDFDWSGGAVGSVFSNNIDFGVNVSGYRWEIRQGMTNGNGGTLVASGTEASGDPYSWGPSGFLWNGVPVNQMFVDVADFNLAPGTYFLGVAPNNDGGTYLVTSGGANSVGSPINNANNFLNWPANGYNYYPYGSPGGGFQQFSIGINPGVPAPASAAVLGLSGLAASRRRRA